MKKFKGLFLFFLLLQGDIRVEIELPRRNVSVLCLYEPATSWVSKTEIFKLLKGFGDARADWAKEIERNLNGYQFIILSKGNLSKREQDLIYKFLRKGGGLILFLPKSYQEEFFRRIGLRFYEISQADYEIEWNESFFQRRPSTSFLPYKGIIVKTGYAGRIREPSRGNVFPERIPVRDYKPLLRISDKAKNLIGSGIVLVKHWFNPWNLKDRVPSNWLIFSAQQIDLSQDFYKKLAFLVSSKLAIKELRAEMPLYERGEEVKIFLEIVNAGKAAENIQLLVEISSDTGSLYSSLRSFFVQPGQNRVELKAGRKFEPGFYKLKTSLYQAGEVIDYYLNAFLVKGKEWKKRMPRFEIKRGKILIDSREKFVWGTNYYQSKRGELIWLWPNLYWINQDFKLMKKMGLDMVRIHYHHPKWFRDYLEKINSPLLEFFPQKSYLPSEQDLRILDSVIYLAQLNGLIISLDIFSLLPDEMGNPLGWLAMTERIRDEEKIKVQLKFVELLAERYKDIPGISWDLWNEPRIPQNLLPQLKLWAERIIQEFRRNKAFQPITIGGRDSIYLEDILDYISIHSDKLLPAPETDRPVILQEFWIAEDLAQEIKQAEKLKEILKQLKETGYQGFLPWQWTRQSRLWDTSLPEKWDDDLGLFLREDRSLKPAAYLFLK